MMGESILDITRGEMEWVTEAMRSIMVFLEECAGGGQPVFAGKFEVDIIEDGYEGLRSHIRESVSFVRERWNAILDNDLYQQEVRDCVRACRDFRSTVEAFDESFSVNRDRALTVFSDEWISRRYLEMVVKMRDRCRYISDFVNANFKERVIDGDPFRGAARRFKPYFNGVSDDSLRSLVLNQIPLPQKVRWLGDRREATVFGKTLGLSCSLMNKSFQFLSRKGIPRDLNYGSDCPTLDYGTYDITPILYSLPVRREK